MIERLSDDAITVIQSEQYLNGLSIIVKELVENSLDANAKTIKVYLDENEIRIEDDGDGISNLELVGKLGYTSKQGVSHFVIDNTKPYETFSYGFRGQALYAMSNIADLEIKTRVKDRKAEKKCFKSGKVSLCNREKGTTIKIKNIFHSSKIRRQTFLASIAKDRKKICNILESYCFINAVNFYVYSKAKLVYKQSGTGNIESELQNKYSISLKESYDIFKTDSYTLYLSKTGCTNKVNSYIYIDKRPVEIKSIKKAIETTCSLFYTKHPQFVLLLNYYSDFNVSVDKSFALLQNEKELCKSIERDIMSKYENEMTIKAPNCTKNGVYNEVSGLLSPIKMNVSYKKGLLGKPITRNTEPGSVTTNSPFETCTEKEPKKTDILVTKADQADLQNDISSLGSLLCNDENNIYSENDIPKVIEIVKNSDTYNDYDTLIQEYIDEYNATNRDPMNSFLESNEDIKFGIQIKQNKRPKYDKVLEPAQPRYHATNKILTEDASQTTDYLTNVITGHCTDLNQPNTFLDNKYEDLQLLDNNLNENVSIEKNDFLCMKVLGQFNKGFILTKMNKDQNELMFIVDQHAADEIYNYERLKDNYTVHKQRLIIPLKIKANEMDKFNILSNKEAIKDNGYVIDDDFNLLTVPTYKGTVFNIDDFWDVLHQITVIQSNTKYVLIKKLCDIMASKACRMSIMIGESLSDAQMKKVIQNLGSLKYPWKCPHGRPVVRVLHINKCADVV